LTGFTFELNFSFFFGLSLSICAGCDFFRYVNNSIRKLGHLPTNIIRLIFMMSNDPVDSAFFTKFFKFALLV
jgi:hypothetical protein